MRKTLITTAISAALMLSACSEPSTDATINSKAAETPTTMTKALPIQPTTAAAAAATTTATFSNGAARSLERSDYFFRWIFDELRGSYS